jgi:hypothetical protein
MYPKTKSPKVLHMLSCRGQIIQSCHPNKGPSILDDSTKSQPVCFGGQWSGEYELVDLFLALNSSVFVVCCPCGKGEENCGLCTGGGWASCWGQEYWGLCWGGSSGWFGHDNWACATLWGILSLLKPRVLLVWRVSTSAYGSSDGIPDPMPESRYCRLSLLEGVKILPLCPSKYLSPYFLRKPSCTKDHSSDGRTEGCVIVLDKLYRL